MSPKNGDFEFSRISRRDRVGFSKLFGPAYALILCHGQIDANGNSMLPKKSWNNKDTRHKINSLRAQNLIFTKKFQT